MNIIRIFDMELPAGARKIVEVAARHADIRTLSALYQEGRRFLWLR